MASGVCVKDLQKSHGSGQVLTPVLRGVSFDVERGAFMAIVGPSGCGKTTLLTILGALDRANSGKITVGDFDLTGASDGKLADYRRRRVGFIFQFYNLLPSLTALENVESSLEFLGLSTTARRERGRDYLSRVALVEHAAKYPAQLSGGQQQRVAVARALAREPELLLADEPTGNLDQESGERVFESIRDLQRKMGVTCLMVTHDAALAARTDRVVHMRDGAVVTEGTPAKRSSVEAAQ